MKHSRIILLLFFITAFFPVFSQTQADSISLIFPKVLIINDRQETLLAFDSNRKAYEVPAFGVIRGPIDFDTYIKKAAEEIGITFSSYRLAGLFTYIFPDRYRTYIRPYFVARFNEYIDHHNLPGSSYKWVSYKEAIKSIPYPASAKIVEKVLLQPQCVWAATFEEYGYTNPVDTSKIVFKTLVDFYKLN